MAEKETLLLVEDEMLTARREQRVLERAGYRVVHATDGESALQIVDGMVDGELQPGLVLMDIDLGEGMDGTECARHILKRCSVPLVFLSSHTEPEVVEKTEQITSYGYVVKQAGDTVLLASIKMAFRLYYARQQLEQSRQQALEHEARYRQLFENSSSGIAIYQPVDGGGDFVFKDFNRAAEMMDQQQRSELIGQRLSIVRPAVVEFGLLDVLRRVYRTGNAERMPIREYRDEQLQGVYDNFIYPLPNGEIVAAFDNVTEQEQNRLALEDSQRLLKMVLDGSRLGIWEWNIQTGKTTFNERWAEIIGYSLAELQPVLIETWSSFTHPDDLQWSQRLLQEHFAGNSDYYECEARMRHRDGHWVWVLDRGWVTERDAQGAPVKMAGTHQDITRRKEAELALKERIKEKTCLAEISRAVRYEALPVEERLRRVVRLIPAGWQYPELTAVKLQWGQIHFEEGETSQVGEWMFAPLLISDRVQGRIEVGYTDSKKHYLPEERSLLNSIADLISHALQREQAEQALKASEALNRSVVSGIAEGVIVCDADGVITTWNSAAERIFGYSENQMKEKNLSSLAPPEDREKQKTVFQKVLQDGLLKLKGIRRKHRDGRLLRLDINLSRIETADGPRICGILRDISSEWENQEQLRISEQWFRKIFEESPVGSVVADIAGTVIRANAEYSRITGIPRDQLPGMNFTEFTVAGDVAVEGEKLSKLASGEIRRFEMIKQYRQPGGKIVPANLLVTMLEGDPPTVLGLVQDETERQQIMGRQKKAVEEKELLLREMQHRIKNNLYAVSNLLAFDGERIQDQESRRLIAKAQARIQLMQEVYDQLHRAAEVDRFDLGNYLRRSAGRLLELYLNERCRVKLIVDAAESIQVSYVKALPFGLLLNELLANTVKHAFAGKQEGTVRVALKKNGLQAVLSVEDNGCGLPDDVDLGGGDTFGFSLIQILTEQLGGKVEFVSPGNLSVDRDEKKGVSVTVLFSIL